MDALNQTRSQVTALLTRNDLSDEERQNQLLNLIYFELRSMAQRKMNTERKDHTLSATALVHEAYLRLVNQTGLNWDSKRHFFAAVAESMRRILIESARAKASLKRGANAQHTNNLNLSTDDSLGFEMLALDRALTQLESKDTVMSDVVKLRFFSGLNVEQTAMALELSPRTVNRHWTAARAWLITQMQ
ncbi:ECF-type sigma factor [Marinicella litoralis]|uniref:RNA polymerase ECF family sigma subunit n=1 Tax=Marinicella litoralis TaxID=644220 RepID=A0A4R6XUT1_9GAMM|nr:ECF-type sigma factor [Marinicella litoralis]TDR23596.1 RNA polymerase ECF family sigma subunit [Marinicella litoralis]